jgi:hypothetical protein
MAHLLPLFDNKIELALASYNWGMANLRFLIEEMHSRDLEILKTSPKFPHETKVYIDRVMGYYGDYKLAEKESDE